MNGCKNLSSLPNAICNLMSLKTLNLSDCSSLVKLPENLGNLEGLKELNVSGIAVGLFSSSSLLKNLKKLSIGGCAFLLSKKLLNFLLTQTLSSLSTDIS